MPIGSGTVYNVNDVIISQVSSSGTAFLETKLAAATSSLIYFDSDARINSASLSSITVGTASYFNGNSISSSYSSTSSYSIYAETSSNAQNAQDILLYVKNTSGAIISKGSIVRIKDVENSSYNPTIELADFRYESSSANTVGYANEQFAINAFGYVITEGKLVGVDTSAFSAGDLLYLSSSGQYTNVVPIPPNHTVRVGQVIRSNNSNGSIYVTIDNGAELDELHNVIDTSTTSSHGDLLVKSGSVWKNNKNLTGSYFITGNLDITQNISASATGSFGVVGISTSSPVNSLSVIGATSIGSSTYNTIAPTNGLIVEGNVGIGRTNPSYKLDVVGNVRLNNTLFVYNTSNGVTPFAVYDTSSAIPIFRVLQDSGSNPSAVAIMRDVNNTNVIQFNTNGTSYFNGGSLAIGKISAVNKLDVNGNISASVVTASLFFGTSSWSTNATTASFLPVGTYNITSSWANNAVTASYVNVSALNAFVQGGNSFGTTATLGTNDNNGLTIETSGSRRAFVTNNGKIIIGDSTTADSDLNLRDNKILSLGSSGGYHNIYLQRPLVASSGYHRFHLGTRWYYDETANVWTASAQPNPDNPDWIAIDGPGSYLSFKVGSITGSTTSLTTSSYNDSERLRITTAATVLFNSGSDTEFRIVTNDSTNDPKLTFYSSSTALWAVGVDDSDDDKFKINQGSSLATSNVLTINTSSNVGIGTTSPTATLHVAGTINLSTHLRSNWGDNVWNVAQFPNNSTLSPTYNMGFSVDAANRIFYINNKNNDGAATDPNGGIVFRTGATPSNRMIISYGGNVGVGTTNPVNKLDVAGNISASVITASLFFGTSSWSTNSLTASYLVPTNSYTITDLTASNISASGNGYFNNVGVGTTAITEKVNVAGNILLLNGSNRFVRIGSSTNYNYDLQTTGNDFQIIEAGTTPRLTIQYPNGNVGIGTTSNILGKLQIDSTSTPYYGPATSSATANGLLIIGNATADVVNTFGVDISGTAYAWIQPRKSSAATYYALSLNPNGGNVGIGTINPSYTLDVSGSSRFGYTATNTHQFTGSVSLTDGLSAVNLTASNATINGNLTVTGSIFATLFSGSNIYITSSQLVVTDNILTLNALSPYQRYAGIEMYDSGSGNLSSFLWDGQGDYFFISGSGINGKIISGPDGQLNLTSGRITKATAGNILGDSIIYDLGNGIRVDGFVSASSFTSSVVNAIGFLGTSSWATNSSTASFLPVGTYNITSSWSTNSLTASSLVTTNSYTITNLTASNISASGNGYFNNVGIGTTSSSAKLEVSASSNIPIVNLYRNVASATSPILYSIEANGSPGKTNVALFERLNNLTAANISASSAGIRIREHASNYALSIEDHLNNSYLVIKGGGNVGIGINDPSAKLQINGNISGSSFTSSISNAVGFLGTSSWAVNSSTASFLPSGTYNFTSSWATNSLTASYLTPSNSYQITNLTASNISASGTIRAVSLIETSTIAAKYNIVPLEDQLEKVTKLNPVSFIYKCNNEPSIGLIAEEVGEIYPEFTTANKDAVAYSKMVSVLIQSVKELKSIVDVQQKQINELLKK